MNAIKCTDLDGDGKLDLVLAGNEFGFLPQLERLDAGRGAVLINKGNAQFKTLPCEESGVEVSGQVRDIIEIKTGTDKQILFLRNDMYPVLFKVKKPAGSVVASSTTKK